MNSSLLVVRILGQRVAVSTDRIRSVIELGNIIPAPRAPRYIVGLTTLRSRTLTVIDTACALGLQDVPQPARLALVVERDGCGYALLVDEIENVVTGETGPCPKGIDLLPGWQRAAQGSLLTESGNVLIIDLETVILGPALEAAA